MIGNAGRVEVDRVNGVNTDLSGRNRIGRNVIATWASQSVFMLSGFVLPRLIDKHLGQDLLGVWDFAWSVVSYFSLVQMGIAGSTSRFVAMHHARRDHEALNRSVSSVTCALLVISVAVLILAFSCVFFLRFFQPKLLIAFLPTTRALILILGCDIAIETVVSVFAGVITGCHRWIVQHIITAVSYTATLGVMFVVLHHGKGLKTVALVFLFGGIVSGLARAIAAFRVCPSLRIRFADVSLKNILEMFRYGGKSALPTVGDLLRNQATSILIALSLGPAALAIFSRSRSLGRLIRDLAAKMSGVLLVSVSSLHARGDSLAIRELLVTATKYTSYFSWPLAMLIVLDGDMLLRLWMGAAYAHRGVAAILVLGQLSAVLQVPGMAIMAGMNRHGKLAAANAIASAVAVIGAALMVKVFHSGLSSVAVAVTIPILAVNIFYIPVRVCGALALSGTRFFTRAIFWPFLAASPFAIGLFLSRWLFQEDARLAIFVGVALGTCFLLPIYWRVAIPDGIKRRICRLIRFQSEPIPSGAPQVESERSLVAK